MSRQVVSTLLGLAGAAAGGAFGYVLFDWMWKQGFYALIVPGAFVGIGCGLLARHRSRARGVICALAGLMLGFYAEWRHAPFLANGQFGYLVTHFYELKGVTQLLIAAGAFAAYWFGKDAGPGAVAEVGPRG